MQSKLYFECHITVEPVFDTKLEVIKLVAAPYRFHVADLLMRKRLADTPERSQFDTFLTGRDKFYGDLEDRMYLLVDDLVERGYAVWRYKIEDTVLDVRLPHDKATRETT